MEPNIILVTGTPGTGKTTTSRLLAAELGATHIELTAYAKKNGLVLRRDTERDTDVVDLKSLHSKLREDTPSPAIFIVDGHYAPEAVDPSRVRAVIVLRRAPWDLKQELELRGYSANKIRENVEAELVGVCLSEALAAQIRVHELDTTGRTPAETVGEMTRILERGGHPPGEVDWMSCPEALKLLQELETCT